MTRLAVVGTDTGVGKTVVTAGLVRQLRDDGVDARAVKPAQTGHPPDDDAGFVREACADGDAALCCRYLEPPLAPTVAAEREGKDLYYEAVRGDCEAALEGAEVGVVEGIGGLRVPLAGEREVVDLVADLGCEAVVVARSSLGTLNHSALTVAALRRRDVPVRYVVLNEYEGATVAERTNPGVLEEMTGLPVHTVPPLDGREPGEMAAAVADELPRAVPEEPDA